jgi:putative NADPH-quinone reductase
MITRLPDKLQSADALVFVYPTWWFNVPAALKGFFDRTLLPGTAFRLPHLEKCDASTTKTSSTGLQPNLLNIKKIGCVSTYGATRAITFAAGDNGRNMITRGILPLFSQKCTVLWLSLHDMDNQTEQGRNEFLRNVRTQFESF